MFWGLQMMTYCSKFNSLLLLLWVRWAFDLFPPSFQLIEIIFHLKKYQVNYLRIPLTSAFLGMFAPQVISIYNSFSGLSSELAKAELFCFIFFLAFMYLQITKELPLVPHMLRASYGHHSKPHSQILLQISPLTPAPCHSIWSRHQSL